MRHTNLSRFLGAALITLACASAVSAQGAPVQASASEGGAKLMVGMAAPDFTATATDSTGRAMPVSLSKLKGKVVVLAFYPADRSRGCTIELTKFRDEYASLFGDGTVVLPTSVDSLGSHAGWAKDAHFPFAMIADTSSTLAKQYQSAVAGRKYFKRTAFVIGKDGSLAYQDLDFNASSQDSYDNLAAAIKTAKSK